MSKEQFSIVGKCLILFSAGVGRTGTLISLVNLMIILKTFKEHIGDDISSI